jgi:hypothetical protein
MQEIVQAAVPGLLLRLGHTVTEPFGSGDLLVLDDQKPRSGTCPARTLNFDSRGGGPGRGGPRPPGGPAPSGGSTAQQGAPDTPFGPQYADTTARFPYVPSGWSQRSQFPWTAK